MRNTIEQVQYSTQRNIKGRAQGGKMRGAAKIENFSFIQ